ncbi:hypothetical protein FK268_08465 [Tsukamurella sputi]|uniref:Uncharacterized protein n=1 Tax=Tsukamurella sputi TaxID=2591848 RepID=A0A5C5RRS4_9ACTN|nr:hypothetical protein [Tsukamurella sputi]TWS25228.1 hypothetical protein FK268_08465 [Tsukamurella sputi]
MMFEMDPSAWEREARIVDALADALTAPAPLPLPDDPYARALGAAPAASDALAAELHAVAVADLRALADRIRGRAHAVTGTDRSSASAIEAVR